MVPEALSGFEEIKDILEDFEIEQQQWYMFKIK